MDTFLQDLRYGWRMLLKNRRFAPIAILGLGLGIAAHTAIFTVVNGVLLRPLPFPDPDQIVFLEATNQPAGIRESNVSVPDFEDWRQENQAFSKMALFFNGSGVLTGSDGQPERVPRTAVGADFFPVMGVQPILGRGILQEETQP